MEILRETSRTASLGREGDLDLDRLVEYLKFKIRT